MNSRLCYLCVLLFISVALCALPARAALEPLDLNGAWQVTAAGSNDWFAAKVPGCIHTDLIAAGKIPDPFFRDNEKLVQWVGETNWTYRRTFVVPAALLKRERVLLRCEGLDTLATVSVNGREVGRADNMFRLWEFDVQAALVAGTNTIEVAFASPLPLLRQRTAERPLGEWIGPREPKSRAWVRKEPCNFGWDWGPRLATCGIWRDIKLVAYDTARLDDVNILQDHSLKDAVALTVKVSADVSSAGARLCAQHQSQQGGTQLRLVSDTAALRQTNALTARIEVRHNGHTVTKTTTKLTDGAGTAKLTLTHPQLWWPAGMGAQPLYEVRVELLDARGKTLDKTSRRIGLRTIDLLPPDKTNSLRFAVNGVEFFAKGANWIPADSFPNRVPRERLRQYVRDAAAVNMNLLRFWGGGHYEEPELFDTCDELGILVWLDCKFACSAQPAFDADFMANVRQEIRDNVKERRHHPCIAVWCGNNEISLLTKPEWTKDAMGKADYDRLFSDLIGGEVRACAPQANYVPGSPEVGDNHFWEVWHGDKPLETYRATSGFMSEFGFQSFPEPAALRNFTEPDDLGSLLAPMLQWHQRSGNGNQKIKRTLPRYFREPKDFASAVWLSQLVQGYAIKLGAEHWRADRPRSMGCVFWQYNDCWPVASWSSVDYYGNWKALHYLARRFYAPVLVSGVEDPTNRTVAVSLTSDLREALPAKVTWEVTDAAGVSLMRGGTNLTLAAMSTRRVTTLDLSALVEQHGAGNVLVWLKCEPVAPVALGVSPNSPASENLVTLVRPKDLTLLDPQLQVDVKKSGDRFRVRLTAAHPALWTWLELNTEKGSAPTHYSDNFVHLRPGATAEIWVTPIKRMSLAEFRQALVVRSLFDTYAAFVAP